MARAGYLLYEVRAHARFHRDEGRPLDDLDGQQGSLLYGAGAVCRRLSRAERPHVDDRFEQAFSIDDFRGRGSGALLRASIGPYGNPGTLTNVDSGSRQDFDERHATMIGLRAMLVVPPEERLGFLFCERRGGRHLKNIIQRDILGPVAHHYDVTLDVRPLIDPEAWALFLQSATTYEVTHVYRSTRQEDLGPERRRGGDLRMTVTGGLAARIGLRYRNALAEKVQRRNNEEYVSIDEPALTPRDPEFQRDRAELVVGDEDAGRRTIVIEGTSLPQFHYEMDGRLTDQVLRQAWQDHAEQVSSDVGVTLPAGWHDGDWPPSAEELVIE